MLSDSQKKIMAVILKKAKTKDGDSPPEDMTVDNISACSFYYMLDKDVWQFKFWLYPTNRSKTYNFPIKEDKLKTLVKLVQCINSFELEDEAW